MENLKASLSSLRSNLASAGPIDDELKDLLTQLDGDIRVLLERRAAEADADAASASGSTTYGLAERTQEISARFAAKHPKLEPALRELGNILSSMGI